MALVSLAFSFLLICVGFGAFVSIIVFVLDVIKWHDREETAIQIPSNKPENDERMEVVDDVEESGEHNTSTFLIPRG